MKNLLFDFGTTAIKLTLINSDHSVCSSISKKLEMNITGKKITQSTSEWKKNFFDSLKELLNSTETKNIEYIIGTGQMEDLILIDKNNVVEESATLYSDSFIEGKIPDSEIRKYEDESPNSIDNFTPLVKLLSRIDKDKNYLCDTKEIILGAKDLINYFLTGFSFTDYTNASTTGLFSAENNCWNSHLPKGILNKLPKIEGPTFKIGFMKKEIAKELGLDNIPQVINGIGDAGASTLGSEIEKCGESYIYLGTTGWIAYLQEKFLKSEDFFLLSGPFKNQWQKMGPLLNAGNVFDWAMKNFLNTENYGTANDVIKNNLNTGVLSWPYLNGERSPKKNSDIRGVISGISQDVTSEELFTSFVRSIAFSLRLVSEKMGIQDTRNFKLIGGLTGSSAWCQLLADIMKKKIVVPSSGQSGPQFGLIKLLQKIIKTKSTKSNKYITYVPSGRNYDELYGEYKKFAEDLLENRTSCPSYLR